jgi:energy-converting hydrogenase Eha subunit H
MACFVCELDESACSIRKERKEKINFVFDINCFMILVACVYIYVPFLLNSDSLIKENKERERERKKGIKEREREQSTFLVVRA